MEKILLSFILIIVNFWQSWNDVTERTKGKHICHFLDIQEELKSSVGQCFQVKLKSLFVG